MSILATAHSRHASVGNVCFPSRLLVSTFWFTSVFTCADVRALPVDDWSTVPLTPDEYIEMTHAASEAVNCVVDHYRGLRRHPREVASDLAAKGRTSEVLQWAADAIGVDHALLTSIRNPMLSDSKQIEGALLALAVVMRGTDSSLETPHSRMLTFAAHATTARIMASAASETCVFGSKLSDGLNRILPYARMSRESAAVQSD